VQINELIDLRWNQIRKKRNSQHDQLLKERIKKYISLSEDIDNKTNIEGLCQVVGCFDNNNTLISFLTQKFWKEVPVYYIGNMVVRPNISKLYNVKLILVLDLFEHFLNIILNGLLIILLLEICLKNIGHP
jgi:hypothetical protein